MEKNVENVEKLINMAAKTADSAEAMRFSQAALNAANAMCSLNVAVKTNVK